MIPTLEHPVVGEFQLLGPPIHLSEPQVELRRAPLLGEHTREVLEGELGLAPAELAELARRGVIEEAPAGAHSHP